MGSQRARRAQLQDDRLLRLRRPSDAGVAGEPGGPRAPSVAVEGPGGGAADGDGLRPRPGAGQRARRVLRGGGDPARRAPAARARVLPEDVGLEGDSGLRAPERGRRGLRPRHEADLERARAAPGGGAPEADRLVAEEGAPEEQGADRLEPERRAQDHRRRVLAACPRAADRLDPAGLGRGGGRRSGGARVRGGRRAGARGGARRPVRARRAASSSACRTCRAGTVW